MLRYEICAMILNRERRRDKKKSRGYDFSIFIETRKVLLGSFVNK